MTALNEVMKLRMIATRQTNLENQYEQLIKNFSSSSPSNVEIVDARTGPDGTVYGTLRKRLEDPRCS